jgi:hypothetical protein
VERRAGHCMKQFILEEANWASLGRLADWKANQANSTHSSKAFGWGLVTRHIHTYNTYTPTHSHALCVKRTRKKKDS